MTSPHERGRGSGGFTLIELLVVLTILAVVAAMLMPVLGASLRRAALDGAGAELRAALRDAGAAAIAEGRVTAFRGDPAGGYWIDRRHYALMADPQARIWVAGAGRLSFYPWGGSSGGRVWIDGPHGRREIAVDAVTGHAFLRR